MKRPTLPLAALSVFVAATAIATGLALRSRVENAFALLALVAMFVHVALPDRLARAATWTARALAGAGALLGLVTTLYPVLPDAVTLRGATVGGHVLVALAALLLLARAKEPAGGLVVAALGALVCAGLPPEPDHFRIAGASAAAALVAWLALGNEDDPFGAPVHPRPLAVLLFVALAGGAASWIALTLPVAQPKVEQAVAKMISDDLEATTGLSTESRLGDVAKLARSKRLALRLYADVPQDLRVRAFTRFDGRAWQADPRPATPLQPVTVEDGRWPARDATAGRDLGAPGTRLDGALTATRIVVRAPERGVMPAPAHLRSVRVDSSDLEMSPSGILLPGFAAAFYAVLNAPEDHDEPRPGEDMLGLPPKVDPRLVALAAELSRGAPTDAERVLRTVGHFQGGYRYSLDVGAFRTSDPVAEFVFEKKKGYCEYFGTATTLLLRLQGVPARYVTGYAVRPFQRVGDHYLVRDTDAHAWAEAYVPGRGWIEADATPAADYEALHGDVERSAFDRLQAVWDELTARFAQGGIAALARALFVEHPVVVALLVAVVVARKLRRRGTKPGTPAAARPEARLAPELRTLLARVDGLCAARGAARPAARAPREHVASAALPLSTEERAACLRAVDTVYAQAYGGEAATAARLAELAAAVDALRARPPGDR